MSWARYPCALKEADSFDEEVLTEKLWHSYLKLMAAYGRRLNALLAREWKGPNGFRSRMVSTGRIELDFLPRARSPRRIL